MNVSVIVATFGSDEWRDRGEDAYQAALEHDALEPLRVHDPGGTLAGVRNAAAAEATGDWLCFLDADDSLGDGYLLAMRAAMHGANLWRPADLRANPTLLVPAVQYVRDGRCVGEPAIPQRGRWPELNECVIGTLLPRALFLERGGFRETLADGTPLTSIEDYDLFLRCWEAGARLVYVESAVYCATVSVGGRNADQSIYPKVWEEHVARASRG